MRNAKCARQPAGGGQYNLKSTPEGSSILSSLSSVELALFCSRCGQLHPKLTTGALEQISIILGYFIGAPAWQRLLGMRSQAGQSARLLNGVSTALLNLLPGETLCNATFNTRKIHTNQILVLTCDVASSWTGEGRVDSQAL